MMVADGARCGMKRLATAGFALVAGITLCAMAQKPPAPDGTSPSARTCASALWGDVTFKIEGEDVVRDDGPGMPPVHYKILQNNAYGLVAVRSVSEGTNYTTTLLTHSIVIDKRTKKYWDLL